MCLMGWYTIILTILKPKFFGSQVHCAERLRWCSKDLIPCHFLFHKYFMTPEIHGQQELSMLLGLPGMVTWYVCQTVRSVQN